MGGLLVEEGKEGKKERGGKKKKGRKKVHLHTVYCGKRELIGSGKKREQVGAADSVGQEKKPK